MNRRPVAASLLASLALVLAACAGGPAASPLSSDPDRPSGALNVYAAASLSAAFDEIADAFVQEYPGVTVMPVYDGSSTLATQIGEGAPADVFASADESTLDTVADLAAEPQLFATNTLVIAVPAGNPGAVTGLPDLTRVTTVLCAPEVPCGAASRRLLDIAGVNMTPASIEQNVTAVLTKVAANEADAGLVYATDVIGDDDVDAVVPEGAGEVVNRYPIATLTDAANPAAAAAFVSFVVSDAGRAILQRFGFGAP